MRVAREAPRTLAFCGHDAAIIADVGVAGLWRLIARLEEIRQCRVVIAVAGMEGAIFSVLAGLIAAPRDRGADVRSAMASVPREWPRSTPPSRAARPASSS